jgi:hypothetical protein
VGFFGISKITTAKVSQSLKVSGSFGFETLQTNTASMQASNGIGIQAVAIFLDPGNHKYPVTPVILGNPPPTGIGDSTQPPKADIMTIGPLKTAFVADPLGKGGGRLVALPKSFGLDSEPLSNHAGRRAESCRAMDPHRAGAQRPDPTKLCQHRDRFITDGLRQYRPLYAERCLGFRIFLDSRFFHHQCG